MFSDKTIKKIDHTGNITTVYTSKENSSPLHGTFDNKNKLWVLEGSDNNDVQVMSADMVLVNSTKQDPTKSIMLPYIIICGLVLSIGILYLKTKK